MLTKWQACTSPNKKRQKLKEQHRPPSNNNEGDHDDGKATTPYDQLRALFTDRYRAAGLHTIGRHLCTESASCPLGTREGRWPGSLSLGKLQGLRSRREPIGAWERGLNAVNMTSQLAVNALMVLFRDASDDSEARSPQGFFVDWSESLKPVACEQGPPNALTNKDLSDKDHLWFTWMPPDTAEINVVLRGTFVVGDEYWYNVNVGGDFAVDEFPVSMEGCGDTKSCVTLSRTRTKCDKASRCDLSLTYALGSDNRSLDITMGGAAPVTGQYLALGFTDDPIMLKNANIFACTRTHDLATVQHFTLQDLDSTPVETNQVLEDPSFEQDGERIWCRFSTPVHVAGYDLSLPRHQVYLWGETNVTSQSIKIAPPYMVSKTPIKVGVPIYSRLTRNAATTRTASWIMALSTTLLARILVA
ncbi:hypothetical protein HPB47_008066 [Ixodes persulcatus]|uniref:Uncharacterized protein n=1 Tax=Ixodes persulcatus TaxID=34615 RepID=A0AC60P5S4_IXOPE|nr:hypothetical protein HPB47_008066 [Ixodes persulcatus]